MVKELEISDWDPFEIADMIEGEISALIPHWKKWDLSHPETYHTFNYQDDDGDDGGPRHPFHSFSSCSSSEPLPSGLNRIDEMAEQCGWLQGMFIYLVISKLMCHFACLYHLKNSRTMKYMVLL